MSKPVTIELTGDEALVLFEWLAKLDEAKLVCGEAEKRILWGVEAALERVLVEPLAKNYGELVEQARQRIIGH
ncbi:MAG: hypothetical protein KF764_06660 [Labilithrix sp.]|nr:hypothetical protein [Labilithrix sp.]